MNNKLLTIDEVSSFSNLSRGIVWRAIRDGDLKVFRKKRPMLIALSDVIEWQTTLQKSLEPKISKEDLERFYIAENKTIRQIANLTGLADMIIHRLMVKFGIPRRSQSEALKGRNTWDKSPGAYKKRCNNISKGRTDIKMNISEVDRERRKNHIIRFNTHLPRSKKWTESQRNAHAGEKSYRWKGGSDHYRGPNFQKQRREARKRDNYTCQRCGITEINFGQELDVHHIIPFRKFESYKEANLLDNLICYCKPCHSIVEHELEQQTSSL